MKLPGILTVLLATNFAVAGESWVEPVTGMEFVAVPKGCFSMGVPQDAFRQENAALHARVRNEMPSHEVCLDTFWMGILEVRESDWMKIVGPEDPRSGSRNVPVSKVTWDDARSFAARLGQRSAAGNQFRLPTEAEWEYACRAGAKAQTRLAQGKALDKVAWYSSPYQFEFSGNRLKDLQPGGGKAPNDWGLYDMLGNVWEWVQDDYQPDAYQNHTLYNPLVIASIGKDTGNKKVLRGGSLVSNRHFVRCEARAWYAANISQDSIGFRLVRTLVREP